MRLEHMPASVLNEILSKLDDETRVRAGLVNKTFFTLNCLHRPDITERGTVGLKMVYNEVPRYRIRLPRIVALRYLRFLISKIEGEERVVDAINRLSESGSKRNALMDYCTRTRMSRRLFQAFRMNYMSHSIAAYFMMQYADALFHAGLWAVYMRTQAQLVAVKNQIEDEWADDGWNEGDEEADDDTDDDDSDDDTDGDDSAEEEDMDSGDDTDGDDSDEEEDKDPGDDTDVDDSDEEDKDSDDTDDRKYTDDDDSDNDSGEETSGTYLHHKEIKAAQVIKITAQVGTPNCIPQREFIDIGWIVPVENNQNPVDYGKKGQKVVNKFKAYVANLKEERKRVSTKEAALPCVLEIIPNCVFNKKDCIVLGVDVLEGIAMVDTLICIPQWEIIDTGQIVSIENNHKPVDYAKKGQKGAIKIVGGNSDEQQKMFGRHFEPENELLNQIKENYPVLQ